MLFVYYGAVCQKKIYNGKRGLLTIISLTELYFRKAAHRLDHAHHEKQHQQSVAHGLQAVVYIYDHGPHPAAFEVLRTGGNQRPDLRQLVVPRSQGRVEVVYDPVSASYFYHLAVSNLKIRAAVGNRTAAH